MCSRANTQRSFRGTFRGKFHPDAPFDTLCVSKTHTQRRFCGRSGEVSSKSAPKRTMCVSAQTHIVRFSAAQQNFARKMHGTARCVCIEHPRRPADPGARAGAHRPRRPADPGAHAGAHAHAYNRTIAHPHRTRCPTGSAVTRTAPAATAPGTSCARSGPHPIPDGTKAPAAPRSAQPPRCRPPGPAPVRRDRPAQYTALE